MDRNKHIENLLKSLKEVGYSRQAASVRIGYKPNYITENLTRVKAEGKVDQPDRVRIGLELLLQYAMCKKELEELRNTTSSSVAAYRLVGSIKDAIKEFESASSGGQSKKTGAAEASRDVDSEIKDRDADHPLGYTPEEKNQS